MIRIRPSTKNEPIYQEPSIGGVGCRGALGSLPRNFFKNSKKRPHLSKKFQKSNLVAPTRRPPLF